MHKIYVPESEITYGQKYLLDLMDKKQLAAWCRDNLTEKYAFSYLFHIGTGMVKMPPADLIYKIRHLVFPADWFYTVSEARPEPRALEKRTENFEIEKSKNFVRLKKMYDEKKLYSWCFENHFNYVPFSHVLNRHYALSVNKMKKLRDFFAPADWFIYEDE